MGYIGTTSIPIPMIGDSLYRKIAKVSLTGAMGLFLFFTTIPGIAAALLALPLPAQAADSEVPAPPFYPCPVPAPVLVGSSPGGTVGYQFECHYYEEVQKQNDNALRSWQFAVVFGLLDAMQLFVQKIAIETAKWILNGAHGKPAYFTSQWDKFLGDALMDSANVFLTRMDKFTQTELGFSFCQPIDLNLKISLALSVGAIPLPKADCTFTKIVGSFEKTYHNMTSAAVALNLKNMLKRGNNEFDMNIGFHQAFLESINTKITGQLLNRQEAGGLKPILDSISGRVKTPSQVAKDTLTETNSTRLLIENGRQNTTQMAYAAFQAGLTQLPIIAGATFLNTLAAGAIEALFNALAGNGQDDAVTAAPDLTNPDLQPAAELGNNADQLGGIGALDPAIAALSDLLAPNLSTSEKQDFIFLMSACNTPRDLWGCSMDQTLADALRSPGENGYSTVGQALGLAKGGSNVFLHKDWELIPDRESKDDQDPGCFQRAYCAGNLAKLRFARIIPIGWEIAANSQYNNKKNGKYVTLEEVARNFNNCSHDPNNTDVNGHLDASHPWCHLIDPAWVMVAPPFQCRTKGYSDFVLSAGSQVQRMQECSDEVSCLQRNEKGECTGGYGYCLADKTVWRFGGDVCKEQFASCRTFTTRDNKQVSYVRNSVDYASCSEENVGCTAYYSLRDTSTPSTDKWTDVIPASQHHVPEAITDAAAFNGGVYHTSRIYFDATAQPCDASQDGCTKVLKIDPNVPALNIVKNGSFETMDKADKTKLGTWVSIDNASFTSFAAKTGISAFDGGQSLEYPSAALHSFGQWIRVSPLHSYVLSFYARANETSGGTHAANASLLLYKQLPAPGSNIFDPSLFATPAAGKKYYRSVNCNRTGASAALSDTVNPNVGDASITSSDWKRYTCEFVTNDAALYAIVGIAGQGVAVDAIQVEEGDSARGFIDGVNASLAPDYLKIAPDELSCTGDKKSDRAECANYARFCSQADVGCQGYTDVNSGTFEVPATINPTDVCPNSCVGYAEYTKLPSAFDLTKTSDPADPDDDGVVNFVPNKAAQCRAEAVGCEAFTNVQTSASGGEQKAFYTYVQACQKPGDLSTTYFSWEGSDVTGYQLRTWSLIKGQTDTGPQILQKAGPDGVVKDPALCNADSWKQGTDVDCRQIYDEQGAPYYRFFSQVVISAPECTDYRKNNSTFADCSKTGGSYDPDTKNCIYHVLPSQSAVCEAVDAGCRAYIGTTGRNTDQVLHDSFASTTADAYTGTGVIVSNESLLVGDHSLSITGGTVQTTFPSAAGSLYTVSFWAKTTDAGHKTVTLSVNGSIVGSVKMEVDWRRYEIGPFTASKGPTSVIAWSGLPKTTYLDEVSVQRLQDIVYVVKDSWTVPAECDQAQDGSPQPQAMLGCREYKDRKGAVVDLRQFSHLCRYENIGCSAYVDTRNSDDPYEKMYTLDGTGGVQNVADWLYYSGTEYIFHPGSRYAYLIDEPSAHCDAGNVSCRAFGKPIFDPHLAVTTTQTVYLKADVSQYMDDSGEPKMLCRPNEVFCDKFTAHTQQGPTISYFRNPQDHVCEWKDKVDFKGVPGFSDGTYSGWFVKGTATPEPCDPGYVSSGSTFKIDYPANFPYRGYVGTCPNDQAECTEFRDPFDHTDPSHPSGRSYFLINNAKIDTTSCGGKVDPDIGCVLFRDTSDAVQTINTAATYITYHDKGNAAIAPVDCESNPTLPACVTGAGLCKNFVFSSPKNDPGYADFITFCGGKNGSIDRDTCATNYVQKCQADPSNKYCDLSDTTTPSYQTLFGIVIYYFWSFQHQDAACTSNTDCTLTSAKGELQIAGSCVGGKDDANLIVKVKLDRDCSRWLGCKSGETTYDPGQQKYVDICTDYAVCDQSAGSTGKNFCAHYTDRSQESVLKTYALADDLTYASRPVSVGQLDFSGYTLANRFQITDMSLSTIGTASSKPRLSTAVIGKYLNVNLGLADLDAAIRDPSHPALNIPVNGGTITGYCRHTVSGKIGLWIDDGNGTAVCVFPVDLPDLDDAQTVNALGKILDEAHPENFPVLSAAFPSAECKANPDAQSPFATKIVKEWDMTVDPPKPKSFVDGYDNAPYCEKGEDCTCSYRKVSYGVGTTSKYYGLFSAHAPPSGVCLGGEHDGATCTPMVSNGTQVVTSECGSQGTCQQLTSSSLIRGQAGYCVERDKTINLGGKDEHPCLVWHPLPASQTDKDYYHFQPTAGYLPPQNSGEYYCASRPYTSTDGTIQPTKSLTFGDPQKDVGSDTSEIDDETTDPTLAYSDDKTAPIQDTDSEWDRSFVSPGNARNFRYVNGIRKFKDNELYQSFIDGKTFWDYWGTKCDLDGNNVYNSDYQVNSGSSENGSAPGLWIQTGTNANSNYAEYVIGLKGPAWVDVKAGDIKFVDVTDAQKTTLTAWGLKCTTSGAVAAKAAVPPSRGNPGSPAVAAVAGTTDCQNENDDQRLVGGVAGYMAKYLYPTEYTEATSKDWTAPFYWKSLLNDPSGTLVTDKILSHQSLLEDNFEFFKFDVLNPSTAKESSDTYKDKQAQGNLGCMYTPDWVPGTEPDDWTSAPSIQAQSKQWLTSFRKDFPGYLSRKGSDYLKTEDGQYLYKLPCKYAEDAGDPSVVDGTCFYKYWETGYKDQDQSKFQMLYGGKGGLGPVSLDPKKSYVLKSADGDHPYFSIRAMWEDANPSDNDVRTPEDLAKTGNDLKGPFKLVGFWVTSAAPGSSHGSFINLSTWTSMPDICKDVDQVVAGNTRASVAFTDRVWENGTFSVPALGYTYSSQNSPFGAVIHQKPIGTDPVFSGTSPKLLGKNDGFIKSGSEYEPNREPLNKQRLLSNLFARVYQVYRYYKMPVVKGNFVCGAGPMAGQWCPTMDGNNGRPKWETADYTDPTKGIFTKDAFQKLSSQYCGVDGACSTYTNSCDGGVFDGQACAKDTDCQINTSKLDGDTKSWLTWVGYSCMPTVNEDNTAFSPNYSYHDDSHPDAGVYLIGCGTGATTDEIDPDKDDNRCTHGVGYYPNLNYCGPGSVECLRGLKLETAVSDYVKVFQTALGATLPTDVTEGLDYPSAVGFAPSTALPPGTSSYPSYDGKGIQRANRTSPYKPLAPRIAAPDTRKECAAEGQCPISKVDAFNVNGQTEGDIRFATGQANVSVKFYGWAMDNQAPLTDVWIDWGDGNVQKISDARMKNKKPFCGVPKQCDLVPGLSCSSDNDCPPAAGKCVQTGFCSNDPGKYCTSWTDCGQGNSCNYRLTFGSSDQDCEQNYFQFQHEYLCNSAVATCDQVLAQPNGLQFIYKSGCLDTKNNSCGFIPKVYLKDNWGWCTQHPALTALLTGQVGAQVSPGAVAIIAGNNAYYALQEQVTKLPITSIQKYGDFVKRKGGGYDASWNGENNTCNPDFFPVSSAWIPFDGVVHLQAVQ